MLLMFLNLTLTLGAIILGGLITRFYYKKAGDELAKEAARLRHLSSVMLNAMEDSGLVKLNRAESGEIVGRVIPLSATFEGGTKMSGELEVKQARST
jgi:hypothetical protein